MPDMEKPSQRRPASSALVLLDPSFRLVSYNAEAIRILTYPRDAREIHPLTRQIEDQLRLLLRPLRSSPPVALTPAFQSGRRQYGVRIFTLNKHRNGSSSSNGSYPAHAVLFERRDRQAAVLSTVASQFHLTPREQETLLFLTEGMTGKEIANRMGISPHTVKAFFRLIMSKMQVSTRSGIVGKIVRISH